MQYLISGAASLCVLVLMGVSIAANYRFGTHLAPGVEGQAYGALGASADGLKTFLPLLVVGALLAGQKARAFVCVVSYILFAAYSLTSAYGLYALTKSETLGSANAVKARYADLNAERNRLEKKIAGLGPVRSFGAIEADLNAARSDRRYDSTNGCDFADRRAITAAASRTFCNEYARSLGELTTAQEARSLQGMVSKVSVNISSIDLGIVLKSADPSADALARVTGYSAEKVRLALAVLVALIVEFGSGFGLFMALSGLPARGQRRKAKRKSKPLPARTVVADFSNAMICKDANSSITAKDLKTAFDHWCHVQGFEPVSRTALGKAMKSLGMPSEKLGGVQRYAGLKLVVGPRLVAAGG